MTLSEKLNLEENDGNKVKLIEIFFVRQND